MTFCLFDFCIKGRILACGDIWLLESNNMFGEVAQFRMKPDRFLTFLAERELVLMHIENTYIDIEILIFIEMVSHENCNCRRLTWPTLMCTSTTTTELLRTISVSCFLLHPSGQSKTEVETIFRNIQQNILNF